MKELITVDIQTTLELDDYLRDNDIKGINKTPLIKRLSNIDESKHYKIIKDMARSCRIIARYYV